VNPLENIMALSVPNVETGCRVWKSRTDSEGEPVMNARGKRVLVKRYLTAKKMKDLKQRGFYPVFENTCGNRRCVTVSHLRVTGTVPRINGPSGAEA
jgi:hypothetical protein